MKIAAGLIVLRGVGFDPIAFLAFWACTGLRREHPVVLAKIYFTRKVSCRVLQLGTHRRQMHTSYSVVLPLNCSSWNCRNLGIAFYFFGFYPTPCRLAPFSTTVTATNAAFVNRILQRDSVFKQDGPSYARASPYPRFYNYDPKLNRRSCNHRNPHLTRDKAS